MIDKKQILGSIGEKYVCNWLSKEGYIIEQSLDPFDHKKDLLADGKSIEVKTGVPFIKTQQFGVNVSQLGKLKNVDRLFFINVPVKNHDFKYDGWLMEVNSKKFTYNIFETIDGRRMVRIPMIQDAVTPIHKLPDNILKEMMRYSSSSY